MEKGKYIIVLENGHKVPILFHTLITHDTFLKCYSKANIKSAGFFEVFKPLPDTIVVDTFGASQSLEISSDSEDCTLLSNFLKLEKL